MAGVGHVEGGSDPGDPGTDYQRPFGNRHLDRIEWPRSLDPLDGGDDGLAGFGAGLLTVAVDPRTVFANVGYLAQVRVQPGLGGGRAKGRLVQLWRAGGNHHAVEVVLFDGVDHHLLTWSGAQVRVVGCHDSPGDITGKLDHLLYLDVAGDVFSAVADKNADATHLAPPSGGTSIVIPLQPPRTAAALSV